MGTFGRKTGGADDMRLLKPELLAACGVGKTDTVLVGLSGGADSVALLCELVRVCALGMVANVAAAHYNHGMRGAAADADGRFCEELCRARDVRLIAGRGDVPAVARARGLSLETAAREERYAFLERARKEADASCIAVAHHRDDQAETVLLHLFRGAGANGLAGMRPRNGLIVRPFLTVPRADILAYLAAHDVPYRTDETNALPVAERNRVRAELLPLMRSFNPDVAAALCRSAGLLAEDEDCLSALGAVLLEQAALPGGGYDRGALFAAHPAVQARALRALLTGAGAVDIALSDIRRVRALLTAQTGTRIELGAGLSCWVDAFAVHAGRYAKAQPFCVPFCRLGATGTPAGRFFAEEAAAYRAPATPFEAFVDADRLPADLVVRTREDGDRFFPLGAPGERKLSDYFTDKKLPVEKRGLPLLCADSQVLFVPGFTISETVRVTDNTRRVLRIQFEGDTDE